MSEKAQTVLRIVLSALLYLVFVGLTVFGHTMHSWAGVGVMLLGLAGILCMLGIYNAKSR